MLKRSGEEQINGLWFNESYSYIVGLCSGRAQPRRLRALAGEQQVRLSCDQAPQRSAAREVSSGLSDDVERGWVMFKCVHVAVALCLLLWTGAVSAAWSGYININQQIAEPVGVTSRFVLLMESNFHSCGWNGAANITQSVVGDMMFKLLYSTALSAVLAGKPVMLLVDGCSGDRANVVGIQISK